MSFLDKFKATATKVGTQATAFGHTVAREAQTGSQKALTNFKLENEVRALSGRTRERGGGEADGLDSAVPLACDSITCTPRLRSAKSRPRSSPASSQTRNIPRAPLTPSQRKSSAAQRGQSSYFEFASLRSTRPASAKSSRAKLPDRHWARATTGTATRR